MKVVLLGPEIEENLALRYLAAALARAGYSPEVIPFNRMADVRTVVQAVVAGRPGLVGFSLVAQRRYADFAHLARELRAAGYSGHITAGGHFAGLRAAEVLADTPELDSILHHDGEERIVALASWLASRAGTAPDRLPEGPAASRTPVPADSVLVDERTRGSGSAPPPDLDGISWRGTDGEIQHRPPVRVSDLDRLALPLRRRSDRTLGYARAPIVSSRGCSGACSFCSIHAWHRQVHGARLRFRAPALVAAEMTALYRQHGTRVFIFHDDDFIHPDPESALPRCRAILDEAERGIGKPMAFVLKCRPDDVERDLFAYLGTKGLVRAYVGIESHAVSGIAALNRRLTPQTNERALATLRELGVYACFNLLLFHPETTSGELEENLAFLERNAMHPFDVARAELYARSTLEDRMVRDGRVLGDYRGYDYRIADRQAEAIYRVFSEALYDRHFGGRSILHRVQDLGYRASLLRRLHPDLVAADLQNRVDALIRDVNLDTVWLVRRIVDEVVQAGDRWSEARHGALVEELHRTAAARLSGRGIRGGEEPVRERGRSAGQDRRWARLSFELEGRATIGRWRAGLAPGLVPGWPRRFGKAAAVLPFAAVSLGFLSCGGDETHVCDPPPPPPVRYIPDLEPYLSSTCALPDCHAGDSPQEGLDLAAGHGYDNLVEQPSTEVPRLKRVQPSQADSSYLVHKLEGTQLAVGGSGERMPKGGTADGSYIQKIRRWIWSGAPKE